MSSHCTQHRGFVLIAVLVVMGSALLVATSLMFIAQTQTAGAAGTADAAQTRALVWSGVQAVMSLLGDQRQLIFTGETPHLDAQITIYETSKRLGVIRALPIGALGERLSAEAGKLDLNSVDAATLVKTGLLGQAAASAIIDYRDLAPGRAFQSVAELLNIPQAVVTPHMLYGPIDEVKPMNQAQLDRGELDQRVFERLEQPAMAGLAEILTVFSVEPSLQVSGEPRVNLNVDWSAELQQRLIDQLGQDTADAFRKASESGVRFDNEAKIFQALLASKIPPEDWPGIIDAFAVDAQPEQFGRLDINTAPYEALLGLPGITSEQAAAMVRTRRELSAAERATIAWPAIAQIIAPEAYLQLAGKITTRCWTYCVRLAAGEVDIDQPDGPLINPMIYEAVIDLSSSPPRVAYLREITMLQTTAEVASTVSGNQSPQFDPSLESVPSTDQPGADTPPTTSPHAAAAEVPAPEAPGPNAGHSATRPLGAAISPARGRIGRWRTGN